MKKYFGLQLKRAVKILPYVFLILLVTLLSLLIIATGLAQKDATSEENTRFKIAITGDTSGQYVQLGLTALQTFDDSRFSIEIIELTEDEARRQIKAGKISAFVILPPDFIERAIYGDVDTATYVTTAGAQNVVVMFKNEITTLITNMVVYSEKGVYAVDEAYKQNDLTKDKYKHINNLSVEYANIIFSRSNVYVVDELGISTGVDELEYYVCAFAVILLTLIGVAFATVYVKSDYALPKLLISKRSSIFSQILSEYLAHFLSMIILLISLVGVVVLGATAMRLNINFNLNELISLLLRLVPVVLMISAFNILVFEISSNIVTAILLHFFSCIAQLYVSGCFYPVYALPVGIQKISSYLPCGVAREYLEGSFLAEARLEKLAVLLGFALVFFCVAVLTRKHKVLRESR